MEPARFGRVLGIGTRLAAKTLVSAVDAATSESPASVPRTASAARRETPVSRPASRIVERAPESVSRARVTAGGLKQGGKKFGEAVWGPFARLSGVLWLEVTGVFFGLFAFLAAVGAWKHRVALHHAASVQDARSKVFLLGAVAVLLGYFCVSNFVKANRRGRRK